MLPRARHVTALIVGLLALLPAVASTGQAPTASSSAAPANELDRLMARVLDRREDDWKKLHDYILDETERFELTGPNDARLYGMKRDFTWYVRDGYLIRSPLRYDGVTIGEAERRRYEERWLADERTREARRKVRDKTPVEPANAADKQEKTGAKQPADPLAPADQAAEGNASLQAFVDERGEPRFISESFFLRFKFEPGNYYLAGRERIDGREVLRVEYYPTKLFTDEHRREGRAKQQASEKDREFENRIQRDMNKVALVTIWVDPAAYRIVRYTFDNVDFGFLPARWLFRLGTVTASMTMSQVFPDVWLPKEITGKALLTLATGDYEANYSRQFFDYRKGEVRARVRVVGGDKR